MDVDSHAVVVLGHGSRNPAALEVLEKVAGLLALQTGWDVGHASLDFNRPTLAEAVEALYARGHREITVAPYLLYAGNHVARDIPGQMEELLVEHSDLELSLADPLGLDLRLISVLEGRGGSAAACPRQLWSRRPTSRERASRSSRGCCPTCT
jgi:sirohydrochlorin ferrochelatase